MKVIEITVTRGFTANIGNYSNVKFELGMTADLSEGETADEALALLDKQVSDYVAARRKFISDWLRKKNGADDQQGDGGQQS